MWVTLRVARMRTWAVAARRPSTVGSRFGVPILPQVALDREVAVFADIGHGQKRLFKRAASAAEQHLTQDRAVLGFGRDALLRRTQFQRTNDGFFELSDDEFGPAEIGAHCLPSQVPYSSYTSRRWPIFTGGSMR